MATAKKYPEFELPSKLLETLKTYLGTAKMSKLTANQRSRIAAVMNDAGRDVGAIIDPPNTISITEADRPD